MTEKEITEDHVGLHGVHGPVESTLSDPTPRGFEIAAAVVCAIIAASIVMCYFTWRYRYKIILRAVIQLLFNYFLLIYE